MSIKYEIHTIKKAQGSDGNRRFALIHEQNAMSDEQLEEYIQASCSLTRGDVRAALSALRECMLRELGSGHRFALPGIGYLSLSVHLDMTESIPDDKARADYIRVRGLNFRPCRSLLDGVRRSVSFERAQFSSKSQQYDEAELADRLRAFLASNSCLTRRDMEQVFGLRKSMALRWLNHFVATGLLKRGGVKSAPVYFMR